jgi:hypothetical protein
MRGCCCAKYRDTEGSGGLKGVLGSSTWAYGEVCTKIMGLMGESI